MTSYRPRSFAVSTADAQQRRLAGAAVTVLVHLVLLLGWQAARRLPPDEPEGLRRAIQWIGLPALPQLPAPPPDVIVPVTHPATRPDVRPLQRPAAAIPAPTAPPSTPAAPATPAAASPAPSPVFSADTPAAPGAETIMERARRSAGAVDRALRQENRPYIVAPLDSPEIRMRQRMERAHALAPPALWEAPKVEELVNQTGDGARRTRVITARKSSCITERAPTTNVEMIEMHGKLRLTNCPQHEDIATQQAWRTARD